jgi:hypothetical protein
MNKFHKNFYFKALIKTFKIHKRLNDADLKNILQFFGKYDEDGFHLPHLLFSVMPFSNIFDLVDTYCNLIGRKYAKDVAFYHLKKIKDGNKFKGGDLKFTTQQFERLLNGEEIMLHSFIYAIKHYQIKNWIRKNMNCPNSLDDKGFYDIIYGNEC